MRKIDLTKQLHLTDVHEIPDGIAAMLLLQNEGDVSYLEDILSSLPEDNLDFLDCAEDKRIGKICDNKANFSRSLHLKLGDIN